MSAALAWLADLGITWADGLLVLGIIHLYLRETACRTELAKYKLAFARLLDFVTYMMDRNVRLKRRPTEAEFFNPDFNVGSLFEEAPGDRRRRARARAGAERLVQRDVHIP